MASYEAAINAANQTVLAAQAAQHELSIVASTASAELLALDNKLTQSTAEATALNSRIVGLNSELSTVKSQLTQSNIDLDVAKAKIVELQKQLDAFQPKPKKRSSGLVVVDPAKLAAVSKYGLDKVVVKIAWATVEPEQGKYNWSAVDSVLSAYSDAEVILRIQAGDTAPQWLKTATGTVKCFNKARSIDAYPCKWWTTTARDAWKNMINAAGAKYDLNERVVMVSADLPMVVFSEPYILGNDNDSAIRLFNAGLTLDVQKQSIALCVDDTVTAFPHTLVELALHSDLQYPTATGVKASVDEGLSLALQIATKHGARVVFSDYGLGTVDTLAAHTPTGTIETERDLYAWMYLRSHGGDAPWAGPISFQLTVGKEPQTQETYRKAAQNAIDFGAWFCETSGWGLLSDLATGLDTKLKANQS